MVRAIENVEGTYTSHQVKPLVDKAFEKPTSTRKIGAYLRRLYLLKVIDRRETFNGNFIYWNTHIPELEENHYKPYTKEEEQQILDMRENGVTQEEIGKRMGRSRSGIRTKIWSLLKNG